MPLVKGGCRHNEPGCSGWNSPNPSAGSRGSRASGDVVAERDGLLAAALTYVPIKVRLRVGVLPHGHSASAA
jgi:hypothetical protein